jgi:hypothetical protein
MKYSQGNRARTTTETEQIMIKSYKKNATQNSKSLHQKLRRWTKEYNEKISWAAK